MFAPSKEYLYASYTYRLQNGNSWAVCSQLFRKRVNHFRKEVNCTR